MKYWRETLAIIQRIASTKCTDVLVQRSKPISFSEILQCHLIGLDQEKLVVHFFMYRCFVTKVSCIACLKSVQISCGTTVHVTFVSFGSGSSQPRTSVPEHCGGRRADEDEMVAAIVQQSCCCSSLQASLVFFTLLSDSVLTANFYCYM